jgi:hypothetical protein
MDEWSHDARTRRFTAADSRNVLVEGESRILACHPSDYRPPLRAVEAAIDVAAGFCGLGPSLELLGSSGVAH